MQSMHVHASACAHVLGKLCITLQIAGIAHNSVAGEGPTTSIDYHRLS